MGISKVLAGGVAMLAAAVLAGCARETGAASQATGTVHGMITMTGGPRGASPAAAAGTVIAEKGGKQVARQNVTQRQQFSFPLPAGTYELSVSGAGLPCADATVTVAAGTDQNVALVCSRK